MSRKTVELIHEGNAAEVPVELIEDETGCSPYLSIDDAFKRQFPTTPKDNGAEE